MMHRLHFEEAQPSSFAISPARSNGEIRDDAESESLAAEFQSLLAQLTGQITAIPDQGVALGLALAQTVAPERLRQTDDQRDDRAETSSGEQQDAFSDTLSAKSDSTTSDSIDNRLRGRQEGQSSTEGAAEQERENSLVNTGEIVVESGEMSQEVAQVVQQVTAQSVSEEVFTALTGEITEGPLVTEQLVVAEEANQKEVQTIVVEGVANEEAVATVVQQELGPVRRSVKKEANEDQDEGAAEDSLFAQGYAADVETQDQGAILKKNIAALNRKHVDSENDAQHAHSSATTVSTHQHQQQSSLGNADTRGWQRFDNAEVGSQQRVGEGGKKGEGRTLSVQEHLAPESFVPGESKRSEARSDSTLQMMLLRQAFEGVRAARSDGSELTRNRAQTQSVQGAVTAAEPRAAQGESASRSKPLSRPQIGRMLERVESTLKQAARARDGKTISLHLEPVDLGKVKVDVSLREGALHARISPDNQQVAQALREHAHELQGALRKLGLEVDSVSVSVTMDESFGEMTTGQETMDGRSFHEERNNMPNERAQVLDNTIGNELALTSKANGDSGRAGARSAADHWIA
ncbi:MAG: flagellar hook-length control protein FliK [Pseudomonadota bacterium]|jgi:flagellar hook-length control protein FliK